MLYGNSLFYTDLGETNRILLGFIIFAILSVAFYLLILLISDYRRSTQGFELPQVECIIDISNKRNVLLEDYIDYWIIEHRHEDYRSLYAVVVSQWNNEIENVLKGQRFFRNRLREKYLAATLLSQSPEHLAFLFIFVRKQTRYYQIAYNKMPYHVDNVDSMLALSISDLENRREKLRRIDYSMPLNQYNQRDQRRLMTPELRRRIKLRDNYTCQICGKYMPDEVGLHIDHIVPISKGGKTVPSNLQVLCDKCNFSKGSK